MTQPARPTITIAVAAYNCAATVGATIDSCLAQTRLGIEVLVVDDGSTDATPAVLASYGDRIRVIRQPNGGLANARNTGMREARGDFIAWMDADDLCMPDRMLVQSAVLEAFPDVVLVSSNFTAFRRPEMADDALYLTTYYAAPGRLGGLDAIYPSACTLDVADAASGHRFRVRRGQVYDLLLDGNFVHPPTAMFRRSAQQSAGECDTSLRYSSDYELFVRLARLGEFALVETPLLRYRLSDSQMSKAAISGTMQLETISIMDRIRQVDPSVYQRQRALFERRYARSYLSAAEAIGNSDRARSLRLLWRGLGHRILPTEGARALGRILLPQALRPVLRRLSRLLARS